MNSIAKIQEKLCEKGLDAILITDEKNQRYAAGFPFTDGYVLVSREKAWLLTDSRYIEAAESSVDSCVTVQMFDRQHSRLSLLTAALQEAKVSRLGAEEQKLINCSCSFSSFSHRYLPSAKLEFRQAKLTTRWNLSTYFCLLNSLNNH